MENKTFRAVNVTTGRVIAEKVQIAKDFRSRSKGLLGRQGLPRDEGLLIKPCNSIHTFFMKFPMDAIFMNRDGRVLRVCTDIKPWRLCGCLAGGYMVLELAQGVSLRSDVSVGDVIKIC